MSSGDVRGLIGDAMDDPAFEHRFREDPEAVLDDYDLTDEEREAVLAGDQNDIQFLVEDVDGPMAAYRDHIIT